MSTALKEVSMQTKTLEIILKVIEILASIFNSINDKGEKTNDSTGSTQKE